MKTSFEEKDGKYIMHFEGRLDTASSVSSSGLRLFLALLKVAKAKGSKVCVAGMNDNLRQVFAMTGFTHLFEFV